MKRALIPVALLVAIGLLWGWAMFWPKAPEPLPDRLVGLYRLVEYEPPKGTSPPNPYIPGQVHYYEFMADGTYRHTIRVAAEKYEIQRLEGHARVDERQLLCFSQVARNRVGDEAETERYSMRWALDKSGERLVLTHVDHGYELYLLRQKRG